MYPTKELDNETSQTYFGARYYDSELSGWLSVDPMSDKYPSLSSYCYTADNPVVLVDPNGMDWIESENGDITWRNDVNKYNYSDLLKEGEIFRGIKYAQTKEWNNNRYQGIRNNHWGKFLNTVDPLSTKTRKEYKNNVPML